MNVTLKTYEEIKTNTSNIQQNLKSCENALYQPNKIKGNQCAINQWNHTKSRYCKQIEIRENQRTTHQSNQKSQTKRPHVFYTVIPLRKSHVSHKRQNNFRESCTLLFQKSNQTDFRDKDTKNFGALAEVGLRIFNIHLSYLSFFATPNICWQICWSSSDPCPMWCKHPFSMWCKHPVESAL